MTFVSYAQNFEDVLLWRALGTVERGFYIDVGAQHPDVDSVTRAFYDRGWSGVNIEPLQAEAARIRAARPRDVTLQLALGAAPGEAVLHALDGTGLSTLDPAVAAGHAQTRIVREVVVPVRTLAEICRLYAPDDIHFLKIDVEGAERAVLEGADLVSFRPWIILAEATAPASTIPTHAGWEPLLLDAEYRFVWFDGLNRYYVAAERHDALAPAFSTPPNVFDDFLRAADGVLAQRIGAAETELASLRAAVSDAQAGLDAGAARERRAVEHAEHELARLRELLGRQAEEAAQAEHERRELAQALHDARHELQQTHLRLQATEHERHDARHELQQTHLRLQATECRLQAMETSRSWRVTAPLRRAVIRTGLRPDAAAPVAAPPVPAPSPDPVPAPPPHLPVPGTEADPPAAPGDDLATEPLPILTPPPVLLGAGEGGLLAVHQFHSGSAVGDAITNAMLLTRTLLRAMGYDSEIFVEQPPAALAHLLQPMERLPRHDRYVLIVRHSMGYDRFAQVLDLPAPKILLYHNITPSALLARHLHLAHYARLGREQLGAFRGRVRAALADSEYNALELRRLGLSPVRACTLLFDTAALRARAAAAAGTRAADAPFTVLFVGRIVEAKGQLALVEAFAAFRAQLGAPSRLVLVGRDEGAADPYAAALRRRIDVLGLDQDVVLAGAVPDDTLDRWYASADLYVSLSRHEGFGVPLVEAMAHRVPVLAWPGGAVPYTLAGAGRLLDSLHPDAVAAAMLSLARDPAAADRQRARQDAALDRFALDRQRDVLRDALLRAGAEPPNDRDTPTLLDDNLRYTVSGHVNGSYSLAAINRELALQLEQARPGRVRLRPVEGGDTLDLSGVPPEQRDSVTALVHREPHPTGPELVISQHYPVHVPSRPGDVPVAMLFWEESLLPAETIALLGRHFRAVVAPTAFVRDVLLDSGLSIPVRVIPPALRLDCFAGLRAARTARPARDVHCFLPHSFLHVSSCFPRKGVDVLLRAWARAFRVGDPVRLLIKGFPNPHNTVAADLAALQASNPDLAPVELIDRDLDPDALLALYAGADTAVLPTRGEGYNLPAAEALAAGLPLIVTGGGGHMDFCAGPEGALPGVRLLRTRASPSGSHFAVAHASWLEPDEDDLVAALRDAAVAADRPMPSPPAVLSPDALARAYACLATDLLLAPPPAPLRVSWISSWNLRCGIAEYSRHLIGAMDADAVRIRVLCDRRTQIGESDGAVFWPCWQLGDPRTVEPLAAVLAADDADAVVIQHQPGLLPFRDLARLVSHPVLGDRVVVVTLHNTRDLLDLSGADRIAVTGALARVDRLLVHTPADVERLRDLGLARNVSLLPHGVAPPLPVRPARVLRPDDADGPLIGCYGFFLPGKGIDVLIEAASRLRAQWPHLRLLLVNAEYNSLESRDEMRRCRQLAEALGLADRIEFRTAFLPQTQALDMLTACDILALPYQPSREAASGAVRGALITGVPVAVTPIALFEELGEAVHRCDGIDADDLAAGLDRLLGDPALRQQVQDAAQAWIAVRQWPDATRRLQGMLTGLVRTKKLG